MGDGRWTMDDDRMTAYCLLLTAYRLLLTAYCLLPTAYYLLTTTNSRRPALHPLPRGRDDAVESGPLRLPAEIALDPLRARHQHGWIAGAARRGALRNRSAGHARGGVDHFA